MGNLGAILYLGLSIILFWVLCGFLEEWLATDLPSFDRECGVCGWPAGWNIGSKLHASDRVWKEVSKETKWKEQISSLVKMFSLLLEQKHSSILSLLRAPLPSKECYKGKKLILDNFASLPLCCVGLLQREDGCTDLLIQDKASTTDQARILL